MNKLLRVLALCAFFVAFSVADHHESDSSHQHNVPPKPTGPGVVFVEPFDDSWSERWVVTKDPDYQGTWKVEQGQGEPSIPGDKGLVVGDVARKHGISAKLPRVIESKDNQDLVVQYEVKLQKSLDCGGAYLKLLTANSSFDPADFNGMTPYTIMFGPDKCGSTNKVHFIFRHKNPITGEYQEKHLDNPPTIKNDRNTHLYTLHVKPDNTFEIFIDQESVRTGSLLEDFEPPVNPPKEIDDPTDIKPADWVDEAKIPDLEARKPDDWDEDAPMEIDDPDDTKPATWLDDEPEFIPDPTAQKPEEWDEDFDGDWEPPVIPNPKCEEFGCGEWRPRKIPNPNYKGKWKPPMIDNPAYKGEWKARQIPNPHYFEDLHPHRFSPMGAVGIEIWTMTNEIMFDNIFIGHDLAAAQQYAKDTWGVKHAVEAERKRKQEEANRPGMFTEWFEQVREMAETNPLMLAATAVAGILPLLLCCCWAGRRTTSSQPAQPSSEGSSEAQQEKKEDTAAAQTDGAAAKKENATETAGSPKKRRTPKADQ